MEFLSYFEADTVSGVIVTRILIGLFVLWLAVLFLYSVYLWKIWKKIKMSADANTLELFLKNGLPIKNKSFGAAEQEKLRKRAESVFDTYSTRVSLKPTTPIYNHVRAIFDAGWKETRLDIGELIKHTNGKIFGPGNFLKSVLTLFLIIGLFGTLIGLAESFSNLSQFASRDQINSQTQAAFTDAVKNLLVSLKSAFAPSLLGISFTVLGVFLFSIVVTVFSGLKSEIERITLTRWVPELFSTLAVQRRFQAAEKVADFAEDIQKNIEKFNEKLLNTNGTLDKLTSASENLILHSELFVEGVNQIQNFEGNLQKLYDQMVTQSSTFHNNVKDTLGYLKDSQDNTSRNFENQGEQIEKVITGLKSYEDSYIKTREDMDLNIKEVLVAARNSYSGIVERNTELITKVGDPLREELVSKIGEINQTMETQLLAIEQRFAGFDAPIAEASKKIADTLNVVLVRTDKINQEFHDEFIEQTQNNTEQLKELKAVNGQVGNIFNDLLTHNSKHSAQFDQFNNSIALLSESINSLRKTVNLDGATGGNRNFSQSTNISIFQLAEMLSKILENGDRQKEGFSRLEKIIETLEKNEQETPSDESKGWTPFRR